MIENFGSSNLSLIRKKMIIFSNYHSSVHENECVCIIIQVCMKTSVYYLCCRKREQFHELHHAVVICQLCPHMPAYVKL